MTKPDLVKHRLPRPAQALRRKPRSSGLPSVAKSTVVDCALYVDGARVEGDLPFDHAIADARATGGFVWVGLRSPDAATLARVAQEFGLHPLAVEDAATAHQRPKLEQYGDSLFMVLRTAGYVEHAPGEWASETIETGEVMLFLGADFVVTVRHGEVCPLDGVRTRLERYPHLLKDGPSSVLHGVADHVVDEYLAVARALQIDIDEVEADVFAPQGRSDTTRIYTLKREILEFKRAVQPLGRPLQKLLTEPHPLVDTEIREYIRDVEDHRQIVAEQVEAFDDLLTNVLSAYLARVAVQQNDDMRKITAWAGIAAVPTAVAGIYGMNFDHMPELHWTFGYPLVLVVIAVACSLLYRAFRRSGWL